MVLSVLRLLITPLVSFGHGAVCPSSSDYTFGISWPWCCLSFVFWLHLWYLLAIETEGQTAPWPKDTKGVIRRRRTDSTMAKRYQRCNQKTKDRLVSFGHGAVCPSSSDYPFGIFWPWCCLSFVFWLPLWYLLAMVVSVLRLLITPLVSFGHGGPTDTKGLIRTRRTDSNMAKRYQRGNQKTKDREHHGRPWCCLSFVFWLHLWYLLAMVLSVLRFLITPLVSFGHGAVCLSVSDYTFGISLIRNWRTYSTIAKRYQRVIRRWKTDNTMAKRYQRCNLKPKDRQHHVCLSVSDYTFGISWPWCCLSFIFWLPFDIF
jgi:hypothetical protein